MQIRSLDNDGWTASANAMCTCIIAIVLLVLTISNFVNKKTIHHPEGGAQA